MACGLVPSLGSIILCSLIRGCSFITRYSRRKKGLRRVTSWLLDHFASGLIRQDEDLTDVISFLRREHRVLKAKTFVANAIFQGRFNLCSQLEGDLGAGNGI